MMDTKLEPAVAKARVCCLLLALRPCLHVSLLVPVLCACLCGSQGTQHCLHPRFFNSRNSCCAGHDEGRARRAASQLNCRAHRRPPPPRSTYFLQDMMKGAPDTLHSEFHLTYSMLLNLLK